MLTGGTGSGHIHCPYLVSLDEGLTNEGMKLYGLLSDIYKTHIETISRPAAEAAVDDAGKDTDKEGAPS